MHRIGTILNTNIVETRAIIKQIRKIARTYGVKVTARGRCKSRKQVFEMTGREYSIWMANQNDISLTQSEAAYCYAFVLYRTLSRTASEKDMESADYKMLEPAYTKTDVAWGNNPLSLAIRKQL